MTHCTLVRAAVVIHVMCRCQRRARRGWRGCGTSVTGRELNRDAIERYSLLLQQVSASPMPLHRSVSHKPSRLIALGWLFGVLLTPLSLPAQEDAYSFYENALTQFNDGKLPEAVIEIKNALQRDASMLPAHVLLARIYLAVASPAAAEEALNHARRLGGDPAQLWPLRAQAMLMMGRHSELLRSVPSQGFPPDVQSQLLVLRGQAQLATFDIAAAEESFANAVALTPAKGEPLVAMAKAALRRGDIDSAASRVEKALMVASNFADAWALKGDVAHLRGQVSEALDAYAAALDLEPKHADARLARIGILVSESRFDEAERDLAWLNERGSLDPRTSYLQSVVLTKRGQRSQAAEMLARARAQLEELGDQLIGESSQLIMVAGLTYFELGQFERSKNYLEQYIKRHAQAIGARKLLAAIHLKEDNSQLAVNVLEEALAYGGNDQHFLSLLSDAYVAQGRSDIATRYLEKALTLGRDDTGIRFRLGLSKIGMGQDAEGMAMLEALFQQDAVRFQSVGMQLAALRIERGLFAQALTVTEQLVAGAPENFNYHNLHGSALFGLGRTEAARAAFEKSVSIRPDHLPAQVNLGKLAMSQGRFDAARAALEKALELRPEDVTVMVELSRVASRAGDQEAAKRWIEKARSTDPKSVPAAMSAVDLHLRNGDARAALEVAEQALTWSPDNIDVLAGLARAHIAVQRKDIAIGLYQRMSRIIGFDAVRQLRVARDQIRVGVFEDALYSVDKGLKGNPSHTELRILQAELLLRTRRHDDARVAIEQLQSAHPELAAGHRLHGQLELALGQFDSAREAFERAMAKEPSVRNVLNLSQAHIASGDNDEAKQVLARWVDANPGSTVVVMALAERHLLAGELDGAKRRYQQVLEADPRNTMAMNNLAHVFDQLDDPMAVDLARQAHALAPEDADVIDTLGWLLVRHGDPQEGLRYLRDANARRGSNPEIRYHIAEALAALGRSDEARRELQAALDLTAPFPSADKARRLLQRLQQ